jgi:hypothetical protein
LFFVQLKLVSSSFVSATFSIKQVPSLETRLEYFLRTPLSTCVQVVPHGRAAGAEEVLTAERWQAAAERTTKNKIKT